MVTQVTTANFSSATLTALTSPTITSITVTNNAYVPTGETAVSLSGGYVTVVGSSFVSGATVYIDSTPATAVTFVNSTQLNVQVPGLASNSYIVYVINLDGSVAIRVNGINYSANPTWVTSGTQAYTSGTISLQLVASSDSTVIYTVASGSSLPAGLTLTSSGLLSGVVTGSGIITYNFSVVATDVETQRSTQAFSITITFSDPYWNYTTLLLNGETPVTSFITDASTNNFNSTIAGDTRPTLFIPYQNGYYSNYFDGTGDSLTAPAGTAFAPGTGNFTVEGWYYSTAASGSQQIWAQTVGGTDYFNVMFEQGNSRFRFIGNNVNAYSTAIATANTWNHFAVVRVGTSVTVYCNGIGGTPATFADNFSNTTYVPTISGYTHSATLMLTGYLSNLRYVKGVAVYTGNFTPPTTPLTATQSSGTNISAITGSQTSFLSCQSNRFIDNSLNNFTITKNGDTTVSPFIPFSSPTSVTVNNVYSTYFGGTDARLTVPAGTAFAYGTDDFTVEGWFLVSDMTASSIRIIFSQTVSGTNYFVMGPQSSGVVLTGKIAFTGAASGGGTEILSGSNLFTAGTWNHFAVCRVSGTVIVYLNGLGGTPTVNTTDFSNTSLVPTIGGYTHATSQNFSGYVSNLRVVKGVAVYTSNFTPATSNLTSTQSVNVNGNPSAAITGAQTSLLTCQNSTLIDNSSYVLTITPLGQSQPINSTTPFTQTTTSVALTTLGGTYFDGTGDYLSIPNNAALNIGTSDFTIECWVYPTAFNSSNTIIGKGTNNLIFGFNSSGTLEIAQYGVAQRVLASTNLILNQWSYVVASRVSSTSRIFINGVQVGSGSDSSNYTSATVLQIGQDPLNSAQKITGYISNIRVINGTALYTSNFAPPVQPLTAVTNTSLLTLQYNGGANNSGIIDNSSLNNVITRFGNTSQGTFSPYGSNWSNYFDGTGDSLTVPTNAAFSLGTSNFTIEGWFYLTTFASFAPLISKSASTNATSDWAIYVSQTTGFLKAEALSASSYVGSCTSSAAVPRNAWNHFAWVRSGSNFVLYLNGVSVATATDATSAGNGTGSLVRLGMDNGYTSGAFTGYMSNMRVVKGTALYTATFTPSTTPLTPITNTSLLTCQSARFVDNGPYSFALTSVGDTSVQRFSPFGNVIQTPISYGAFFNGNTNSFNTPYNVALNLYQSVCTIECWVYLTSNPASDASLYGTTVWDSSSAYVLFAVNTSGYLIYYTRNMTSVPISTTTVPLNQWVHVAWCRTGSLGVTFTFYINGVISGTGSMTGRGEDAWPTNLVVGIGNFLNDRFIPGTISNLRVVKGVEVYSGAFTVPTSPLTATQSSGTNISAITGTSTSFLTCQNITFIDNSVNAFPITSSGSVYSRTFNPFGVTNNTNQAYTPALYGGSSYFDGTGDYLRSGPYTGQSLFTPSFSAAQNVSATIEFWVYPTTTGAGRPYTYSTSSVSTGADVGIYFVTNGSGSSYSVQFGWYNATSGYSVTGGAALPYSWTHVAGTYNPSGGVGTLYVNGVSVGTPVSGGNVNGGPNSAGNYSITNAYNYIGVYSPGSSPSYFTGYMTDFRYTLKSIVYTTPFVPPQAPLTATTNNTTMLLNFTNGGVIDYHTNNVLETVGNAQLSTGLKQFGNASMSFDGSTSYLVGPPDPSGTFAAGNLTIECWVYFNNVSTNPQIIAQVTNGSSASNYSWQLYLSAASTLTGVIWSSATNYAVSTTVVAGQWYYVALVRNGTTVSLYLNGVSVGTPSTIGTNAMNWFSDSRFYAGRNSTAIHYFNGYLDELRVTKGIARYTSSPFAVPTAAFQTI